MKIILQRQQEIISEFTQLNGNMESILFYLINQGKRLPPMAAQDKNDGSLIKGCQSKVWLKAREESENIYFYADSNTAITRGLIFLLIRILSGQSRENILAAELYFMRENNLNRFIGVQSSNGFAAMAAQMKTYASKFS